MDDLMQTLYQYAYNHRMHVYLSPEDYAETETSAKSLYEKHDLELQAMFQAGFAMGQELSRA